MTLNQVITEKYLSPILNLKFVLFQSEMSFLETLGIPGILANETHTTAARRLPVPNLQPLLASAKENT